MPSSEVTTLRVGPVRVAWAFGADARRRVLSRLLADAGAPDDDIVHQCPHCGSAAHGRPLTSSGTTVVSISHRGELAVAALAHADAAAAVGVDVEADRGREQMADLAPLFAPRPPPDVRGWTAIEAAVKADGRGLRIAPGEVRLSDTAGDLLPGGRLIALQGDRRIEVVGVPAPEGYVISIAIDPARESGQ
ncbi:hypothetical protein [Microbacterium sp. SD291]|uniref:hypothetical protein n=1 Tax=Microbacterium sp. SD291 TaxID=2782007 RepID=UPI001A96A582|nr:hypothetical protein [Microbacterium sp. SD291]MBO0980794.1 hypothetical protein [Microbacterium sp. SD291]